MAARTPRSCGRRDSGGQERGAKCVLSRTRDQLQPLRVEVATRHAQLGGAPTLCAKRGQLRPDRPPEGVPVEVVDEHWSIGHLRALAGAAPPQQSVRAANRSYTRYGPSSGAGCNPHPRGVHAHLNLVVDIYSDLLCHFQRHRERVRNWILERPCVRSAADMDLKVRAVNEP